MAALGAKQLAVRVEDEMLVAIDRKRMQAAEKSGQIPTRSDIVRLALEAYLSASDKKTNEQKK